MIKRTFALLLLLTPMLSRTLGQAILPNGFWQGKLLRADGHSIVFNFETKDSAGHQILYVMNGTERLLVDEIKVSVDSVFIAMPFFDSRFALKVLPDKNLVGTFIKNVGNANQVYPFSAIFNEKKRFNSFSPARANVSGRWSARFVSRQSAEDAIGEFQQHGNEVTGTFLTTTGDYRFLQGIVSGDTLTLSTFDGGHAYAFMAVVNGDSMRLGSFYSGAAGVEQWTAFRNEQAALPDEYSLAKLRPGKTRLDFTFRNIDGGTLSMNDPALKNKVVIIQIMGSWCPNCMDETRFLSDYYKKHRDKGVVVIALAYERTTDFATSKKNLAAFKSRFQVEYPVLVTGVTVSDTALTEKTLPQIEHINGFPTTIFIDRKGEVRKISTGFNGPGTGEHYEIFKKEFDELVTSLERE